MHSATISIPRAPRNFTFTYSNSQFSSFAYSTELTHQSHNFSSESATSVVSSANNSRFISNLPPFALSSSCPFPSTLTFTFQTTPSIYILNNHGDITQPYLNLTLIGNHSLTSISTRTIDIINDNILIIIICCLLQDPACEPPRAPRRHRPRPPADRRQPFSQPDTQPIQVSGQVTVQVRMHVAVHSGL